MITREELRQIVREEVRTTTREEIERGLIMFLDAKTTATAIKKGLFYSDVPLLSHNKSAPQRKSS